MPPLWGYSVHAVAHRELPNEASYIALWTKVTCRPSGALGLFVCRVFYKHAAPLGLNAESNWLPVSAAVVLAQRVGEPNPYECSV